MTRVIDTEQTDIKKTWRVHTLQVFFTGIKLHDIVSRSWPPDKPATEKPLLP